MTMKLAEAGWWIQMRYGFDAGNLYGRSLNSQWYAPDHLVWAPEDNAAWREAARDDRGAIYTVISFDQPIAWYRRSNQRWEMAASHQNRRGAARHMEIVRAAILDIESERMENVRPRERPVIDGWYVAPRNRYEAPQYETPNPMTAAVRHYNTATWTASRSDGTGYTVTIPADTIQHTTGTTTNTWNRAYTIPTRSQEELRRPRPIALDDWLILDDLLNETPRGRTR